MITSNESQRLYTIKQFCEVNLWARPGGIRAQIFNQAENGLKEAGAIIKLGRKVLIDADRYLSWIYSKNGITISKKGAINEK